MAVLSLLGHVRHALSARTGTGEGRLVRSGALAQEVPKAFTCVFESGQAWTHQDGAFKSAPASTLKFDIEAIDLEKQSARLVLEDKQTGTLRTVRALNANSFLEVAQEG
ncbi:MAG: hypothetical protein LCH90_20155, partial [Proteobacteria bacterium]|nr:hypothetical protein [Pseudomonadota bacterium]